MRHPWACVSILVFLGGCTSTTGPSTDLPPSVRASIVGSKIQVRGTRSVYACLSALDGVATAAIPRCDTSWDRVAYLKAGRHHVDLAMSISNGPEGFTVDGSADVDLLPGKSYTVQGKIESGDRLRLWLVDVDGGESAITTVTRDSSIGTPSFLSLPRDEQHFDTPQPYVSNKM